MTLMILKKRPFFGQYDDIDNKWQFGRVNDVSATFYINYSKNHYNYIQPLANNEKDNFFDVEKDECIVPRSDVYSSPGILGKIHKNLTPLYTLVTDKNHSKVELVATDKTKNTKIR